MLTTSLLVRLTFLVTTAMCVEEPVKVPSELRQAFLQRGDFRSAEFKYRRIDVAPPRADQIRNMEQLIIGDDVLEIDRGDDDGIRLKEPASGSPMLGWGGACNSDYTLISRSTNRTWSRVDGMGSVNLMEGEASAVYEDVRLFGISPWIGQDQTLGEMLKELESFPFKKWEIKPEGGLLKVTGRHNRYEKDDAYEWLLDPERDMAIVEIASIRRTNGVEQRHVMALNEYEKVGDKWWPSKTDITYGRGRKYIIEYQEVRFNDATHPQELTLEAMGVPIGASVNVNGSVNLFRQRYAGDGNFMTDEEFQATYSEENLGSLGVLSLLDQYRTQQMQLQWGQYPKWWNDDAEDFGLSARKHDPDAWEAYVRRWKLRHTISVPKPLEQEQINAADAVLKQCRDRAQDLMKKAEKSKADHATTDKKLALIFEELKKRLEGTLASAQTADIKADALPKQMEKR